MSRGEKGFRFSFSFRKSRTDVNQGVDDEVLPVDRPKAREVLASEGAPLSGYQLEVVPLRGNLSFVKGNAVAAKIPGAASHSDLNPGKYEGGLKLWECTLDLVETLRLEIQDARLTFRGKHVLELGCGHGLPGILAMIKGATLMHFQDFNEDVLRSLTIPNVAANLQHRSANPRRSSEFFSTSLGGGLLRTASASGGGAGGAASRAAGNQQCETRYFAGDWGDMEGLLATTEGVEGGEEPGAGGGDVQGQQQERGAASGQEGRLSRVEVEQQSLLDYVVASPGSYSSGRDGIGGGSGRLEEGTPLTPRSLHARTFSRAHEPAPAEGEAPPLEELQGSGYDVVLMSETVYAPGSLRRLARLVKKCMRPPYGVLYVAGKKHYFGVGGGTRTFKHVLEEDGAIVGHLVTEFADGASNVREIWKFFFRNHHLSKTSSNVTDSATPTAADAPSDRPT